MPLSARGVMEMWGGLGGALRGMLLAQLLPLSQILICNTDGYVLLLCSLLLLLLIGLILRVSCRA